MIWQNPWAWLGVATLALPILIHLLGRGHARVAPFPTLRFLERSRLLPTRRTKLHDLLLLLVRLGILLAAVAALAQPLLKSRSRRTSQTLARAIIVDTSASMRRTADSARSEARRLAAEAATNVIIETSRPRSAIAGAADWLARQPGRRELVLLSDFQANVLTAADVATIPASVGVQLRRLGSTAINATIESRSRSLNGETVASVTPSAERTDVAWTTGAARDASTGVELLTGAADLTRAQAASRAAATLGARLPLDTTRSIAIVYPGSTRPTTRAIDAAWMTDIVAHLRADSLLAISAANTPGAAVFDSTGIVVARDAAHHALVVAAQDNARLVLVANADPGSLVSAALIAAVDRARSVAPPLDELDPATIADATLAGWQRTTPDAALADDANLTGESDGRWLWVLALVLLGVETWMRRAKRETVVAEGAHDRAA